MEHLREGTSTEEAANFDSDSRVRAASKRCRSFGETKGSNLSSAAGQSVR